MSAPPLVSVVVPAYNYAHFLGETLASVRAQSLADWECVIVDDGSTDDTWEVALREGRADRRIRYVRQSNRGLSGARNRGLRATSGRYVQLLDADDALEPRKLERQVEYLETHAATDLVYGNVRYFDAQNGERSRGLFSDDEWMPMVSGSGERLLRPLLAANIMVVNAPLVRRSLVDRVGWFDESLTSLEDWDYWLRCAIAGAHFEYFDEEGTLALVRTHRGSMSQNRQAMYAQQARIRSALDARLSGEMKRVNRFWRAHDLEELGAALIERGSRFDGARRLVESALIHRSPRSRRRIAWALRAMLR